MSQNKIFYRADDNQCPVCLGCKRKQNETKKDGWVFLTVFDSQNIAHGSWYCCGECLRTSLNTMAIGSELADFMLDRQEYIKHMEKMQKSSLN